MLMSTVSQRVFWKFKEKLDAEEIKNVWRCRKKYPCSFVYSRVSQIHDASPNIFGTHYSILWSPGDKQFQKFTFDGENLTLKDEKKSGRKQIY